MQCKPTIIMSVVIFCAFFQIPKITKRRGCEPRSDKLAREIQSLKNWVFKISGNASKIAIKIKVSLYIDHIITRTGVLLTCCYAKVPHPLEYCRRSPSGLFGYLLSGGAQNLQARGQLRDI